MPTDPSRAELRRVVEIVLATTAPGPAAALLATWSTVRPILVEMRRDALREAAAYFPGSRWTKAQALASAIADYQARVWPRFEARPTAFATERGLPRILLRLCSLGIRADLKPDRLHQLLSESPARSSDAVVHW